MREKKRGAKRRRGEREEREYVLIYICGFMPPTARTELADARSWKTSSPTMWGMEDPDYCYCCFPGCTGDGNLQ